MLDTILVPTDGSAVAENAAESAIALAARFDATVRILHVLELGELPPGVEDEDADEFTKVGEDAVAAVADLAADTGVDTESVVAEVREPPHEAIVDEAVEHGVDLIVMGTHGRTGLDRYVIGSVAERTLRVSPVPVMTVHEEAGVPDDLALDGILVPTDGSDAADAAVDMGAWLAAETGGRFATINVVDTTVVWDSAGAGEVLDALEEAGRLAIEKAISHARDHGVDTIESEVAQGPPARAIVDYADTHDVDIIVMGTHGRTGLDRYLLGSVTEKVVRQADVPVISVKAPESDE